MKKVLTLLIIGILTLSCSNDDGGTTPDPVTIPVHFKLVVDGVELHIPTGNDPPPVIGVSQGSATKNGDLITVNVAYGNLSQTDSAITLAFTFTTEGKLLSGTMNCTSNNFPNPSYKNFINFPSNYFQVDNFILDEVNHKVKMNFTGNLYFDNHSLTSEARNIHVEIEDMEYEDNPQTGPSIFIYSNVEQYCRANFNTNPWKARYEHIYSSFTNESEYKVEINFANSPSPGSYAFDSLSSTNYVRLSKFNPITLTYDYYNVSGQVGYTYREYHGGSYYSFIGTFSFSAVNPNNPADVIQVTNGEFRSFQQF